MGNASVDQTYREVMAVEPYPATSLYDQASREFVFGVWQRPGLSRRDRRWVTLTCVGAADAPKPIEAHVYAALKSGDIDLDELLEFVLHFAVYCGWPKASHVEGYVRPAWARVQQERGETPAPWPHLEIETLGESDWNERLERGAVEFADVNLMPAPNPDSPYMQAGILGYVFGHVWQRPGLTRRDRRIVTVACVAIDDAPDSAADACHRGAALGRPHQGGDGRDRAPLLDLLRLRERRGAERHRRGGVGHAARPVVALESDPHDLSGRVAIVTGGGTGIGAATARLLARHGADVVIASRTVEELERTAASIGRPRDVVAWRCRPTSRTRSRSRAWSSARSTSSAGSTS